MRELIDKAVRNKQLTASQGASLLRHHQHMSEGHTLFMLNLMITKNLSFKDAHERAMKHVGR